MKLIEKKLVFPNPPGPGVTTAYEYEYYVRPTGVEKVRLRFMDISNDIFDDGSLGFSPDNGETWGEARPHMKSRKTAGGTLRRFDCIGWIDPVEQKLVTLYLEALFRNDNLLEGVERYYLNYRVSTDGGRTSLVDEQVIQNGAEFNAAHPLRGVWVGKNAVMISIYPPMVRTRGGHLCLVASRSLLGPDGKYHNPGGGLTWMEEFVLIGRWRRDGRIDWEPVASLSLGPERSTRGLDECTLAQMADGALLLVMRGSNDAEGKLPGRKWFSVSRDEGFTWSPVQPWGYSDGSLFYSSASMCQLISHTNGKHYWLGNISEENPRANMPRDILYIGEVDPKNYGLKRDTLFVIDRVKPHEPANAQVSNFHAHEDRLTGEIVLTMPYFKPEDGKWRGDTHRYRVSVE